MDSSDPNPLAAVMRLHEEIDALLDDPDQAGTPQEFLTRLSVVAEELAGEAENVTLADFEAEYDTEGEGDNAAELVS